MNVFDRIAIIYNPQSTGQSQELAHTLKTQINAVINIPVDLMTTQRPGHAIELARKTAAKGRPLIVSVSGDGGYNEVINGIMAADNPQAVAAVLPAGNANDHARVMQDEPLLELIKKGDVAKIDLLHMTTIQESGKKDSRYAHSYIGFGLTPTVAVELEKQKKGSVKEIITTLKMFKKFEPFEVEYADGSRAEIDSLVFANISEMAKVANLSQDGSADDGVFEVITIPHGSKAKTAYYAAKAALTGLGNQPSVRSFDFKTLQPMPAQLDGELWHLNEAARVVIRCRKLALATLV